MTTTYTFKAVFTSGGQSYAPNPPATITITDALNNALAVDQPVTVLSNRVCIYSYVGADDLDLVGEFSTTDTVVDQLNLFSYTPSRIVNKLDTRLSLLPALFWNTLTATLTTVNSIGKRLADYVDVAISSRATPADVDLTVALSATQAAAVSTGSLALSASYTLRQTITSTLTQDLSAATKLWLSVKMRKSDIDTQSLVFIEKGGGLTVVNQTAYSTTANGSLTVSGSTGAWEVDVFIDEAATALLFDRSGTQQAELKALIGGDALVVWSGTCVISDGIVRSIA